MSKSDDAPAILTFDEQLTNSSDHIALEQVEICGVASKYVEAGEMLPVWTKNVLTSDDQQFHEIMEQLNLSIIKMTEDAGSKASIRNASTVLLVIKPDQTAKLWIDTLNVTLRARLKSPVRAGEQIYDKQVADVLSLQFLDVDLAPEDGVVFMFREGWRFALFFDFNPEKKLNVPEFYATLGALYRHLKYRETYDAVTNSDTLKQLFLQGWFPFVELSTSEFMSLVYPLEAGKTLGNAETTLIESFDRERIERMFSRWQTKAHFADKEAILRSAIESYLRKDPIATLKTLMTEIEGVLASAHQKIHGSSPQKTDKLLKFASQQGTQMAKGSGTLYFPEEFGRFLKDSSFQNYRADSVEARASSRHAVGHGGAAPDTYTMAHALQAILILDQIAFYT